MRLRRILLGISSSQPSSLCSQRTNSVGLTFRMASSSSSKDTNTATSAEPHSMELPVLPPVPAAYDWEAFRQNAHQTIDFIVDVQKQLHERQLPVQAVVKPGYMAAALPKEAPEQPEPWGSIMGDIQAHVLPGITHWQHPDFYAYFPAMMSPPALLGDLLASSWNTPMFSWVSRPAATEMEIVVMNWLASAFGLPQSMTWAGTGGGVLQASATEAMIVVMLAAMNKAIDRAVSNSGPAPAGTDPAQAKRLHAAKLVCYYSDQSHFCVEKAARVLGVPFQRKCVSALTDGAVASGSGTDPSNSVSGRNLAIDLTKLRAQIEKDLAEGLIPFFLSGNYGATGTCAMDDLNGLADLAKEFGLWFNLDAAYAGVVAMLPECRPMLDGIERCDSVLINGSKWFATMFNSNFMFFNDKRYIASSLNATGVYLANQHTEQGAVVDLKDYHLGLGRPFRSLKVYTTLRSFGLDGLRAMMRRHILLAAELADLLEKDPANPRKDTSSTNSRFVVVRRAFGLVCFRMAEVDCATNTRLLNLLNTPTYGLFLVHTVSEGKVTLRISIAYPKLEHEDMQTLYRKLSSATEEVLKQQQEGTA